MDQEQPTLADRVKRLEERVDRMSAADPPAPPASQTFWALEALKERNPGSVLFTGTVDLPTGEHYEWQEGRDAETLLAADWAETATSLTALAHPVRLLLLREILHGVRTTAELADHEQLGTSGQLYHHLRQLVAAGWLRSAVRGQYTVPPERVVPLLTVLAAAHR